MSDATPDLDRHDHVLLALVMNLQATAMVQLGKMADPASGTLARDVEAARFTIDILDALKHKCRGNLPDEVAALLERTVMDLQLNWTDEAKKSETAEDASTEEDAPADEDGHSAADEASDEQD